jgi:hypothetical protein
VVKAGADNSADGGIHSGGISTGGENANFCDLFAHQIRRIRLFNHLIALAKVIELSDNNCLYE